MIQNISIELQLAKNRKKLETWDQEARPTSVVSSRRVAHELHQIGRLEVEHVDGVVEVPELRGLPILRGIRSELGLILSRYAAKSYRYSARATQANLGGRVGDAIEVAPVDVHDAPRGNGDVEVASGVLRR